ncbi:PREDICTED: uncharacterized protein LOC105541192 [Mandrillus leucophaeus]|uniref:uncharacterized protein LOC105541192 n=1 Tax=Mandrillus leucophaeus TaxID=9568 RepID=UPI0005F36796|nr:PREDICTED: uncharacterized protein LOC105541192 [Mandrillus leucophaeus]
MGEKKRRQSGSGERRPPLREQRDSGGSKRSASGPAPGVDGAANLRVATRSSEECSFPLLEAQAQGPPRGASLGRARPVSAAAYWRQPAGRSCSRPRSEPFGWLHPQWAFPQATPAQVVGGD